MVPCVLKKYFYFSVVLNSQMYGDFLPIKFKTPKKYRDDDVYIAYVQNIKIQHLYDLIIILHFFWIDAI